MAELLLWCGVVAGPLFILIFLVEGYVRPHYNPLRQAVSSLSQGPRGWIQQFNFFSSGALLLACSVGVYIQLSPLGAVWESVLLLLYALGLVGAGVFVTYHGIADRTPKQRTAGKLHDLFSLIVFVSLCIDCFVFGHLFAGLGSNGWALYSNITGVLYGIGFIIFARGFSRNSRLVPIAGLLQRLTISLGAIWVTLVCVYLLVG